MDWDSIGLTSDVLRWLDETGKRTATRERRLDPFATSMRDFDDVAANLDRAGRNLTIVHTDPTQRVADLRSAALVETLDGPARLTALGQAVLVGWRARGVANAEKLDETARTLIAYGIGRQLRVSPYIEFFAYWSELRAVFDAEALIDSWDALFTLNYLDHRIDSFAPGDAYRDEAIPVAEIEYDLDDFAADAAAGDRARKGAGQVARGIQGKVPRGRARATACLAMELLLRAPPDRAALLTRFGIPLRPRQWEQLDDPRRAQLLQIAASFDVAPVTAAAKASNATTPAVAAADQKLAEVDFASTLKPVPRPIKGKGTKNKGGSKKTDYKRRQERNGEVGRLCEEFALAYERWRLKDHPKLAGKVQQVSLEDDTLGYDIRSYEADGSDRFVEVKGTEGPLSTRFFLSANEYDTSKVNQGSYVLMRVANIRATPSCCELRPPFDEIDLKTAVYECTFKRVEKEN